MTPPEPFVRVGWLHLDRDHLLSGHISLPNGTHTVSVPGRLFNAPADMRITDTIRTTENGRSLAVLVAGVWCYIPVRTYYRYLDGQIKAVPVSAPRVALERLKRSRQGAAVVET